MSTVRLIAKNMIVLLIAQAVTMGLGFYNIMYTARYLGAEGFGVLSFALAFTGMFGVFSDLGLSTLTTREVARDKSFAGKYIGNIAVIKVVLVIITFGLIAIAINLLGYPEQTIKVVYLIALSIIFSAFTGMFNSVFQAFQLMEYQSIGGILSSVLMLAGVLIAISQGFSVVGFASIYFIVNAIVLGYSSTVCVWKCVVPKIEFDRKFWKITIREAVPFGLSGIFVMIYYYIDTVMISLMVPNANEVVGWYNASYRLILILLFIPSIYFASIFPVMSKFFKTSAESVRFTFERSYKYMMMIGIPIGFVTTLLAEKIILLIYGIEYIPSIIALQILVWSSVFIFLSQPFGHLFNSINRQITATKIIAVGAVLNIVLNFLVIPKYSYIGASATTVATEFFVLVCCLIASSNSQYKIKNRFILNITLKIGISSSILVLFIRYFDGVNLFLLAISSLILYIISLYLLKSFDKNDMQLFKNFLKLGD